MSVTLRWFLCIATVALACCAVSCDDAPEPQSQDTQTADDLGDVDVGDAAELGEDVLGDVEPDVPAHVRFGLGDEVSVPFPFDLFTAADASTGTGLRLALDLENTATIDRGLHNGFIEPENMLAVLNRLDGFSTFAPVIVAVSEPVDADTVPGSAEASVAPDATVCLIDAEPDSAGFGQRVGVDVSVETYPSAGGANHAIIATPRRPLRQGHTYALVVTVGVKSVEGESLTRHPDFEAAVGLSMAPDDHPNRERLLRATEALAPLQGTLTAASLEMTELAGATVFTTQSASVLAGALSDVTRASDLPFAVDLDAGGDGEPDIYAPDTLPGAPDNIPDMAGVGQVIRGTYEAPDYRGADGDIAVDAAGTPVQNGTMTVPFVLVLPEDEAQQPFPVVVLQHGSGARKEFVLYVAGHLAREGIASIAVDHLGHGELLDQGNFFLVQQPAVVRGTFLQTIAHQTRLFQLVRDLDLDLVPAGAPDGVSDLDRSAPIVFVGESLGGITGAVSSALEPSVEAAVLNVTGGGIRYLMGILIDVFLTSGWMRVQTITLLQAGLDAGDPINFAHLLAAEPLTGHAPMHVLMQNLVGDHLIAAAATEALAASIPLPLVCPCPPGQTMSSLEVFEAPQSTLGLYYFDGAKHGEFLAVIDGVETSDAMRRQMASFVASFLRDGTGVIENPWL